MQPANLLAAVPLVLENEGSFGVLGIGLLCIFMAVFLFLLRDREQSDTPMSCKDWKRDEVRKRAARPSYREARGRLTLKTSADHPGAVRAVCSIEHRVLVLHLALSKASRDTCGDGSQHISPVVLAEVPLEELAIRLQRGRADMFTIATRHKNRLYDEIYCFAEDKAERDEWIAVFRRMCVPILHFREASGAGARDVPLDVVHSPPSEHGPARWASSGAADVVAAGKTIKGDKNEKQAREREKASVDSSKRHAPRDLPPRRT